MPRAIPSWVPWGILVSALAIAIGLTFASLFSTDRIPLFRDVLFFIVPFKHFLAEALRRGELPLWNPTVFLGMPFLANFQSGVFYPPHALALIPLPTGFNLFLIFHYYLAFAGMLFLLHARGLGAAAAGVGGLTFVIGGFMVSML